MGNLSPLEYWKTILNNPLDVVDHFLNKGFLQDANSDVAELLQCSISSADLKVLAKERGIAHSGSKQTVAERLVKADSSGMLQLFRGKQFLKCSKKAGILVDKWQESEKYAESHAEKACSEALAQLRFEDATALAKNYFSTGGLPPPIKTKDVDDEVKPERAWIVTATGELPKDTDIEVYRAEETKAASVNFLNLISTTNLPRHAHFNQDTMRAIQISASMMQLWGRNKPPRWLLENVPVGEYDLEFEARVLLFTVQHIVSLRSMKQAGFTQAKILSSEDPNVCHVCSLDHQKIYPIDSCPVLPHENCTCERGCTCYATASNPDEDTNKTHSRSR